jgi:hypothetical protein
VSSGRKTPPFSHARGRDDRGFRKAGNRITSKAGKAGLPPGTTQGTVERVVETIQRKGSVDFLEMGLRAAVSGSVAVNPRELGCGTYSAVALYYFGWDGFCLGNEKQRNHYSKQDSPFLKKRSKRLLSLRHAHVPGHGR